ncbi:ABC transporter permease [bacterium]|nr:ABC transporter permease [bacterium]
MYPTPDFAPTGFDPSLFLLTSYLLAGTGLVMTGAALLGVVTLPVFFLFVYAAEFALARLSESGLLVFKVALMLFRGLRRSPLRTSLTYLALFVLTFVLTMIYTIITFIGKATAEKEANFKIIMTEKYSIPSMMPPGYEDRLRAIMAGLPKELQPVNGDDDVIAWSFVGGTTDPSNPKPENALFMFCVEPRKIPMMMDGLEKKDLTDAEYADLQKNIKLMEEDFRRIIVSPSRLKKMNVQVGQKLKLTSMNYRDIVFEFEIVGTLPDGKYEGVGFCSRGYLDAMIRSYANAHNGEPHPLANKCVNLIWVRVPNRESYERIAAAVNEPRNFSAPAVKVETASAGIGTFMEAYKSIFFGMKFILAPAMLVIMSLVVANAISISVRERRTEMAVLKVLGFQPWHVAAMILGEALLVGAIAGAMSTAMAWGMLGNFKFQIAFLGAFFVPTEVLVIGPLLGMFVAFIGSVGPAMSAKNVRVAEVFARQA